VTCALRGQGCRLRPGERGIYGLREGHIKGHRLGLAQLAGTTARCLLDWYRDPLPTNC